MVLWAFLYVVDIVEPGKKEKELQCHIDSLRHDLQVSEEMKQSLQEALLEKTSQQGIVVYCIVGNFHKEIFSPILPCACT